MESDRLIMSMNRFNRLVRRREMGISPKGFGEREVNSSVRSDWLWLWLSRGRVRRTSVMMTDPLFPYSACSVSRSCVSRR